MTVDTRTEPPGRPSFREVNGNCGACGRKVGVGSSSGKGRGKAWRCPYTACRAWLRGTDDPPPAPVKADDQNMPA